eukprot:933906-Rhodomonas_salina.2
MPVRLAPAVEDTSGMSPLQLIMHAQNLLDKAVAELIQSSHESQSTRQQALQDHTPELAAALHYVQTAANELHAVVDGSDREQTSS